MIISSMSVSLQLNSIFSKIIFDMFSELGCAAHRVGEVVGLGRESSVVVVKGRMIMIKDSPRVFLPMGRKDDHSFRLRESLSNSVKVLYHEFVGFSLDERIGSSSMGDED